MTITTAIYDAVNETTGRQRQWIKVKDRCQKPMPGSLYQDL